MDASNADQDAVSSRTRDRDCASSETLYSPFSQMNPLPTSSSIKTKHNKQLNFTNPKISSVIWSLYEFIQRYNKFHHMQCVHKIVTHPNVGMLIKSYENYQAFSTNLVCKVRVRRASDKVRGLLGLSCGWSDSLRICEDIAKDVDEKSSGVRNLEVSTWMSVFASFCEELETSYSKFVKQLGLLREQFRTVHRGNDVGSVPDMDEALEDLARTLASERAEDTVRKLSECSKWLVEQVRKVLTMMDECSLKHGASPVIYVSTSLEEDTFVNVDDEKSKDSEKIPDLKVDAEVQTEIEAVTLYVQGSSRESMSPPIAHSTPHTSFEESNPSSRLQKVSETIRYGGEEPRYKVSSVEDLITETFEEEEVGEKFRSLLELLDDGTHTVKSIVVDLIIDKCPHLFK